MSKMAKFENGGMVAVAIMAAAMFAATFIFDTHTRLSGELGLCLPSPNLWDIPHIWSWLADTGIVAIITIGLVMLNRQYNFVRSTRPVLPAMFLIITAANPWITDHLSASNIIGLANLLCLAIIFGCYRERNATREIFFISTILSAGTMVEYAFLPYLIAYLIAAIVMKAMRVKEFIAMILGIVSPWWIAFGLGLVSPLSVRLPEFTNLFDGFAPGSDIIVLLAGTALAVFLGMALGLNNSIKLYAGNSRVNAFNIAVNLVGVVSTVCIIVDFSNMLAYMTTLYMAAAVQVANLCALWPIKREWVIVAVPSLIYAILYVIALLPI